MSLESKGDVCLVLGFLNLVLRDWLETLQK